MNELTRELSPTQDPLEDPFLLLLIDTVQRNPCVYNRYDPLHKMAEYKHEIWKMISLQTEYEGQPVELERKWKHMRDKYVRLRKQDKQKAPIKETNKWYAFYHKMSFLDPYVEHRNRKRQRDYMDNGSPELDEESFFLDDVKTGKKETEKDQGYNSTSSSTSSAMNLESPDELTEEEKNKLAMLYDSFVRNDNNNGTSSLLASVQHAAVAEQPTRSRKRKAPPTQIRQASPSPSPAEKVAKKEESEQSHEDEVTLFIRSITETLTEMDRKKFAMARIEISKVLYNIDYGNIQYSENGIF